MADMQDKNVFEDAAEIIQRFGGIRPMASKLEIPVTTVQGWKKRNIIPENRRGDVLIAAQTHGVDLSDVMEGDVANENSFKTTIDKSSSENKPHTKKKHAEAVESGIRSLDPSIPSIGYEKIMNVIKKSERRAINKSAQISVLLVVLGIALVGMFLLWPSDKDIARLAKLEEISVLAIKDIDNLHDGQFFLMGLLPDDLKQSANELQVQANKIKNTVRVLSAQAENLTNDFLVGDVDALVERVVRLEENISVIMPGSYNSGFIELVERVASLQQTLEGQEQLSRSLDELRKLAMGTQEDETTLGKPLELDLATADTEGSEALSQTLYGVSGDDMKAATMLLVLTKFRESLNRSAPFDEDLALMLKILGDTDPEMNAAIERLAPRAAEGVLTQQGLTDEFKSLAGEIVVASLKGEDISVQERAKARLHEIMRVEKNGELITGTDTQASVVRAQKMLDEGNVKGAIAELRSLEGDAAHVAQPWVDDAEFALFAQELQEMLTGNVLSKLPHGGAGVPYIVGGPVGMNLKNMVRDVKDKMPGKKIIIDKKSGIAILPK